MSKTSEPGAATPRVLRLCSVFEPPDAALSGPGVRFDPVVCARRASTR